MFNTIIISALRDNSSLFIKRIRPVLSIKRIIKAIKD